MSRDLDAVPLELPDAEAYRAVRQVLIESGFTKANIASEIGAKDLSQVKTDDRPLLLYRTRALTPCSVLVRLFLMGEPCERSVVERTVRPTPLDLWLESGLLSVDGDHVRSPIELLPFHDLYMAYDRAVAGRPIPENYVMGVGSSSMTLGNLTVRRPSRRTLDLGTGCGIQAFLASPHSEVVIAADRNPRSVSMTAFNARLNGLSNVAAIQANLFDAVADQSFDLIVSNPPFVVSPSTRFIYRDSGMRGDEITQTIVRQAPAYLAEGGFCQILCNWAQTREQPWSERLASWFEGIGCDALVMESEQGDVATYASTWIRHTERDLNPQEYHRRFDEWLAFYDREGIEAVSAGILTLRKSSDRRPWYRTLPAPARMLGGSGASIERIFQAIDFLETHRRDEALLAATLDVAGSLRWVEAFEPVPTGWRAQSAELRIVEGLAYAGPTDPLFVQVVAHCRGQRPLSSILKQVSEETQTPLDTLAPQCLRIIRELLERGMLVPTGVPTT